LLHDLDGSLRDGTELAVDPVGIEKLHRDEEPLHATHF
jgi:hypothetical protein